VGLQEPRRRDARGGGEGAGRRAQSRARGGAPGVLGPPRPRRFPRAAPRPRGPPRLRRRRWRRWRF
jgi:hypothetical protein